MAALANDRDAPAESMVNLPEIVGEDPGSIMVSA
jgi:hypothetical protein